MDSIQNILCVMCEAWFIDKGNIFPLKTVRFFRPDRRFIAVSGSYYQSLSKKLSRPAKASEGIEI
jgi:hypothetical protein